MAKSEKLAKNIAIRLDEETEKRIEHHQVNENRRTISEMARILLVEALDVRESRARRKRA